MYGSFNHDSVRHDSFTEEQPWFGLTRYSMDAPEGWAELAPWSVRTERQLSQDSKHTFEDPEHFSALSYSWGPMVSPVVPTGQGQDADSLSNEPGIFVEDFLPHSMLKACEGLDSVAPKNCPDPQMRSPWSFYPSYPLQRNPRSHITRCATMIPWPYKDICAGEEKISMVLAMKPLGKERIRGGWKDEKQAVCQFGEYRHKHVVALLGNHRMARKMLSEAEQAATNGDKISASFLEDVRVVIEFGQRKGWRDHASDIVVSLGQVCAVCPVVLYDQARLAHEGDVSDKQLASSMFGMSADVLGQYRGWIQRVLSSILPTTLTDAVIDPNPPFFVIACVVLGTLVATQYNRSVRRQAQTHFLRNGAILGLLASLFLSYTQGSEFVATITAIIPMTTVVALLLGLSIDTVKDCLPRRHCRLEKLRHTLEFLQAEALAGRKGIRFVTL